MRSIQWYKVFDDWETAKQLIATGTTRKATIEGRSICIINYGGQFSVVDDLCPHMRASLSKGKLNAFGEIICPLHEYRFSLHNGRESAHRCGDLEIHRIEAKEDGIYIGLEM